MTELTTEQNRLVLIAKARRRRAEAEASPPAASDAFKPTFGQTMADVGMSALNGLGRGLAQGTGDIVSSFQGNVPFYQNPTQQANAVLANALAGLVPTKTKVLASTVRAAANPNAQTFAQMQSTLTGALQPNTKPGEEFKPQTTPGRFAQTAAEFVPMGVAGGPGSVVRRVGESAALGAISEAGGQLTEGTPFEGFARAAAPVIALAVSKSPKALAGALKLGTAEKSSIAVGDKAKALLTEQRAASAAAAAKAEADAIAQAERAKNLLTRQTDTKGRALAALLEDRKATTAAVRRAETKGVTQGKRSETLLGEQAAAEKAATPSPFTEGRVTTLDERGQPIQTDIVKAKENIYETREKEWNKNSKPVDKKAAEKEASGDYISDDKDAKKILKESKAIVNPSPTKSPTATSSPTPEEASVHKKVIDAFEDRLVEVPESFAKSEKAKGMEIIPEEIVDKKTGKRSTKYFRKFKTTYEAVTNLNRRFGDAYYGKDVTGFEGVSNSLIKNMYEKISNIKRNYIGEDLYDPLQESYTKYTKMLAPFNETQIGKSISGTQGTTDIANLTPSQVPGAVLSKGAGGFEQVQALGGNPTNALLDEVATAFNNPKTNAPRTSEEVRTLLYNSDLGSAVTANPTVKAAVAKHLTQLEDAEMAAVKAEGFGKRAEALKVKAGESAKASGAAKAKAQSYDVELANLQSLPPAELPARAEVIFKDMAKNGVINPEQYAQLLSDVRRNKKIGTNAEKLIAKANENAKAAEKAASKATEYETQIASLESLPYKDFASRAETIFDKMAKDGVISKKQYSELLSDVRKAEKDLDKKASKKRILLRVAGLMGILAASKLGADVVSVSKD